jgi:hypothetical protein
MESKLNHSSIEAYSNAFSKKIVNEFFTQENAINGHQILSLTSITQVNYFIIKILFQKWRKETSKLQSPYFDYDAKDVQKSLTDFMNVLSQHISIKKNQFEPLLKKAVQDSILLIFSPYDFYSKEINNPEKSRVSLEELRQAQKYVKVNRHLLDALIARFEEDDIKEVFNDEAFDILNEVCENIKETPEDFDYYIQKFSEVFSLSLDTIYSDSPSMEERGNSGDGEEIVQEDNYPSDDTKVKTNNESINEGYKASSASNLQDRADEIVRSSSLAESMTINKIDSLKKKITINQRFMFVRELFKGNVEEFNQALERLDNFSTYEESLAYLQKDYVVKHKWDLDSEEVVEFLELLARRYK